MYEFTSNIRYSECAPDARLSLAGLVNYFQDCAVFHAIDVNRGPDTWKNEHYGWIITFWQIVVNEYPMVGEEVTTATWAYKFKGFEANRNLTMRDKDGKLLAYANSSWAYFDTAALRPLRVPSYEMDAYGLDPELPMENKAPRRIRIPAENYRAGDPYPRGESRLERSREQRTVHRTHDRVPARRPQGGGAQGSVYLPGKTRGHAGPEGLA